MSVNQGKNEPSLNHIPISPTRERPTATARDRVCHNVGGGFDSGSPCAPRSLAHPYLPSPHPSFLGLTHLTAAAATPFEIIGNFLGDSKTTKAFKSIARASDDEATRFVLREAGDTLLLGTVVLN